MDWRSSKKWPTKQDRASVLSMALCSLLMRAGERCAVMGESEHPRAGRVGLERIARRLALSKGDPKNLDARLPAFTRMVIASDFLDPTETWRERLARFADRRAKGVMLHIIDPAEREFPYRGRVEMRIPGKSLLPPLLVGRAEHARESYKLKFAAHNAAIEQLAGRLGWAYIRPETDKPANTALTALYMAIDGAHA